MTILGYELKWLQIKVFEAWKKSAEKQIYYHE